MNGPGNGWYVDETERAKQAEADRARTAEKRREREQEREKQEYGRDIV